MEQEKFPWIKGRPIELFIESYSNSARTIQVRGYSNNEQIIADHTTSADRSLATSVVPLTEFPDHITVRTAETSVSRGECYVKISVRVEGVVVALLSAGYITDAGTIAYPNGKIESSVEGPGLIRSITGTNPAAGVEFLETVPTGARWRIISVLAIFTTNATVASRVVKFEATDGTNELFKHNMAVSVPASNSRTFCAFEGANVNSTTILAFTGPLAQNNRLPAGGTIGSEVVSLQAGDEWGAPQLLVEEWIEP